jgi:hypothetical protein
MIFDGITELSAPTSNSFHTLCRRFSVSARYGLSSGCGWRRRPSDMEGKVKVKVELSLCLIKHHAVKTYWGVEVYLQAFLTSALDGGEWSASPPGHFNPRERAPGTHWIGGWVGPRAVLDTVVKKKIPSPRRESNPRTPIVQPVAQRYIAANKFNKQARTADKWWPSSLRVARGANSSQ